jgi:hypothetical protein
MAFIKRRRIERMATQTTKAKSTKRNRISAEEFVKAWQTSNSLMEVSEITGMIAAYANSRACRYRKNGVALKKFPRAKNVDWKGLADLAKSCAKG